MATKHAVPAVAADAPQGSPARPAERVRTTAAVVAAGCLLGWALHELAAIFTPLLVAVFLFFLFRPVPKLIARLRIPVWVAYPLLFLLLGLAIFVTGALVQANAEAFAGKWSDYSKRLNAFADAFAHWNDGAVPREAVVGATTVGVAGSPLAPGSLLAAPLLNEQVQKELGRNNPIDWERYVLNDVLHQNWAELIKVGVGTTVGFLEWATLVLFYLLFLFLEAQKLPGRVRRAYPPAVADKALAVARNIVDGINAYLRVKTAVSIGLGAGVALLGFLFGLDFWLLWAVLTFLANYITYVGSIAAWIPPIALAYLQFKSPAAATVFALLVVANRVFWIDYVEIQMSGRHLNLSPLLLLLALAGFAWMWGVVGMVLAVPLVTATKIVLGNFESTKHFAVLASEE
jgi:predicted PurR-regulated permease PerM